MKEKFNLVLSDQFARVSLLLAVFFVVPLVFLILISYGSLPPLIPFFNSMPWGEERLVNSHVTIFLPFILLTVFVGNLLYALIAYKKNVLISRIVLFNCFLFLLLGLLAYLQILFLTF
jgi:hypothetical protein